MSHVNLYLSPTSSRNQLYQQSTAFEEDTAGTGLRAQRGLLSRRSSKHRPYICKSLHGRTIDNAIIIGAGVPQRAKSKIRTQMFRIYHKLAALLEAIIDAGKSTGEFSTRQATRDIVLYLEAVHDGNMLLWYRSGNDPDIGRTLTRATLNGFAHAVQGT
ncbi:hypothetical protein FIU28_17220 [Tardiphaga sp. vice154]|uniref:hypothetical protein n=1 Tax=Tardiphaga sp. vice154 TaxID=2592814 RepID=UPI001162E00F|nr:hypothetical protein [Tardiphaga sp. vice154]QDM22698.1 hypothetical protein FIU28_17220 [Tardiphaga sp. vice154]